MRPSPETSPETSAARASEFQTPRDPLRDAISVLERIDLAALSTHPDTDDAGNRVAVALGYLREAVRIEPQAQSRPKDEPTIIERVRESVGLSGHGFKSEHGVAAVSDPEEVDSGPHEVGFRGA